MTPEPTTTVLVADEALVLAAGVAAGAAVRAVPRASGGRRRPARLDPDAVIDVLADAGPGAVVLARPAWADPPMSSLAALGVVLGCDVVWLPEDDAPAAWALALIASWAAESPPVELVRRAQVAVGLALMAPASLPRRPWGVDDVPVPAVAPDALGRWCDCAWTACEWCDQGGAAGAPCPSCGDVRGAA